MGDRRISCCLLVKDEARRLSGCLESLRPLGAMAEFLVVDTGSRDRTVEIAREFGAQVFEFGFEVVDFSAARNFAIEQARGKWILMMDADETLRPEGLEEIKRLAATGQATEAGYYFERVNAWADGRPPTTDHVVRLFPNSVPYRYRGRVHETIDERRAGVRLLPSTVQIEHSFAAEGEARLRKNLWYIGILREEIAADPTDDTRLDFLAAEYHQAGIYEQATAVAEELVRRRPNDAQQHLFAGTYHLLYQRDYELARRDLENALRLRPGYPEALSFLRLLDGKERSS